MCKPREPTKIKAVMVRMNHEAAVLLDEDKMGLLDEPVHEADQLAHDGD